MAWRYLLLLAVYLALAPSRCSCGRGAADGGIFVRLDGETAVARAEEEKHIAFTLLRSWALGDERKFVELAGPEATADHVMTNSREYTAMVIVVRGEQAPQRRNISAGEPFLLLEPNVLFLYGDASLEHNLPVAAINRAAELLEQVLSRPLFPFRIITRNFNRAWRGGKLYSPFAVYDASKGIIYLDRSVPETIAELPMKAGAAVESFAERLFAGLAAAVGEAKEGAETEAASGATYAARLVAKVTAAALAATLAAQVPVWFCVACPIVLGLLAPFAFNLGLGAVAEELCEHYDLPSEECNDLWYGAFALAMILSLASAIPIVYVCRLPECARRAATYAFPNA